LLRGIALEYGSAEVRRVFENIEVTHQHSAISQSCLRPSADWDWVWDWDWDTQASRLDHAWDTQASRLGHPWVELNKWFGLQQKLEKRGVGCAEIAVIARDQGKEKPYR
jgi:hypothetical protein